MKRLLCAALPALLLAGCGADRDGGKATATASGDGAPAPAYFDWFEYTGRDDLFAAPLAEGQFRNPILAGFYPDPAICRVGEDYYIATSTFEWYPGVQIHHSRDLANWELVTRPLNRASQLDMRGNPDSCGVWAPWAAAAAITAGKSA